MVLQAKWLSMRAVALRAPTNWVMGLTMLTSMVIYRLQQMHRVLTDVWELAEWVTEAEEVVHEEMSHFGALPDPDVPDNQGDQFVDGEYFDYLA